MIKEHAMTLDEEERRGCNGCIHHIIVPEQLCEYCDLPDDECTHGDD